MEPNLHPVQNTLPALHHYHPTQPLNSPFAETSSKVITGSFGTILYHQINGYYKTYRHYHCFIKQAGRWPPRHNHQWIDQGELCAGYHFVLVQGGVV